MRPLNERPPGPLLSFLTSAFLILMSTSQCNATRIVFAHHVCGDANVAAGQVIPKTADCRFLLAHLPFLNPGEEHLYPLTPALHAAPLLPPIRMRHESCHFIFGWMHESERYGDRGGNVSAMVPLELIWKMADYGAGTIIAKCGQDRQYGNFFGRVQLKDEGYTDVHVSNYATVDGIRAQDDLIRRSRKRLEMRLTATGALSTEYDDEGAEYDLFRSQLLIV